MGKKRASLLLPIITGILALTVAAQAEEEFLPTPHTAEQIRDAWVEVFEVTTRTHSAKGESYSRTRVVACAETSFALVENEVDGKGRPALGGGESYYSGTWEGLRDHTCFPVSRATRERAEWETPLGHLAGWLYKVRGEEGVTEYFFADDLPGPPVVYRRLGEGPDGFVAEQVKREVRPPEPR